MKIFKYFTVVPFVLFFEDFSANAQLAEHIYALDKDSIDDASFSSSDFNIVGEKNPARHKISPNGNKVNLGYPRGIFSGLTLFKNEETDEYFLHIPDAYHNRGHERVAVPEDHMWWPHLKVSHDYDLTTAQKNAMNAYFGTEGQSVAGALHDTGHVSRGGVHHSDFF